MSAIRPHNEDCFVTKVASGLVVLADGMGGYNAGEVASGLATALLARGVEAVWPAIVARVSREESKGARGTFAPRGNSIHQSGYLP
jgi:serine/threonine protein phosphatase PrpC